MWETWVGKIPWRKERLSTPVFWPGEFHRWVHGLPKSRTRLSDFHYTSSIDLGTVCLQVQDRFVPSFLRPVLGIVAAYVMDTVFSSVQFSSITQLCLTLCNPLNRGTPGLLSITNSWSPPIPPLLSPSPPAFNLSQHQGLLKWVRFSHQVAKVLDLQLQHQCFQRVFRVGFL